MDRDALPQSLRAPAICPVGAEPIAVLGDRRGALLLHGLTGSPWELAPLARALAEDGRSVAVPLLAGHGTSPRALENTAWTDWLASGRSALRWLEKRCRRIDVIGFSMGSLAALRLVAEIAPSQRGRLVLIAPALAVAPWQARLLQGIRAIGLAPVFTSPNGLLPPDQRPPRYDELPLRAVYQMLDFQADVLRRPPPDVQACLVLHGTADRSIPAEPALARVRQLLGDIAEVRQIPRAGHLLLTEKAGPERVQAVLEFLSRRA